MNTRVSLCFPYSLEGQPSDTSPEDPVELGERTVPLIIGLLRQETPDFLGRTLKRIMETLRDSVKQVCPL